MAQEDEAQGQELQAAPEQQAQVRRDTVDTILEEGIDFTISVQQKSILHRLHLAPRKRKFVIRPLNMGTLLKISEILLGIDADELTHAIRGESDVNFLDLGAKTIVEHKDAVVKMIAYGIVNRPKDPSRRLLRFLDENLTAKEALKLLTVVVQQMDVNPFLASLVSMKGINLLQTKGAITHGVSSEG